EHQRGRGAAVAALRVRDRRPPAGRVPASAAGPGGRAGDVPRAVSLRRRLSKHALGLWFLGIAALGLLRFWMEWREAGNAPLPGDAWLWLVGSGVCAAVGGIVLIRSGRRPGA